MNNRYSAMFDRLRAGGEGAFGGFVMLGDPSLESCGTILDALVEGGADMIEVGIPFSDPVADGPTIQAAAVRALEQGVTPADCLELIAAFRTRHPDIPIGVLTYANIVMARGVDEFYRACAVAGVDSLLVADVPVFEATPYVEAGRRHGVAPVLIAAPNTSGETLERLSELGQGYTYCVARAGVTGAETEMQLNHGPLFDRLREHDAPPPILGFGISRPDQAKAAIEAGAAGVISGSAIVKLIEQNGAGAADSVRAFVAGMKEACRDGGPAEAMRTT